MFSASVTSHHWPGARPCAVWIPLPLLFTFPTISLPMTVQVSALMVTEPPVAPLLSGLTRMSLSRLWVTSSGLAMAWVAEPSSWIYLDTRGDDGLETILRRLERPGKWEDADARTSPGCRVPPPDLSHLASVCPEQRARWFPFADETPAAPPQTSRPWSRCEAQRALGSLSMTD